ncbi:hypothetical protein ABIB40_003156 [Pedobacter sp. UYP30]|uniref:DUF6891 domain-containing protein n=1 Tax=Pedobacter sp. UYP30 TaxID=1756400 RepID=UPI00339B86A9
MGIFDFLKNNNLKSKTENILQSKEPQDQELKNEVLEFIRQEIKFGFDNQADILEAVWTAGFENEDQLNEEWLKQIIAEHYSQNQTESKRWTKPTDFDKLANVFDELNQEKIIALHKAGYTKQDGYSDVSEVVHLLKDGNIIPLGYCFYHTQDLERAIDPTGKNLFLAFDDIKQNTEESILIGQKIVSKLHEKGFIVEWNGTIEQRIEIKNISWQKIPDGQPWGITRTMEYLNKRIE